MATVQLRSALGQRTLPDSLQVGQGGIAAHKNTASDKWPETAQDDPHVVEVEHRASLWLPSRARSPSRSVEPSLILREIYIILITQY